MYYFYEAADFLMIALSDFIRESNISASKEYQI